MTDINSIVVYGHIVRDLDDRSFAYTNGGAARLMLSIAVNRSVKKNDQWVDEVSYFDVTVWGKQAENLKPYLHKGTGLIVEGYLKQDRWEKDGKKNSRVYIVANSVQLAGGKKEGGSSSAPASSAPASDDYNPSEGFPEDIPF